MNTRLRFKKIIDQEFNISYITKSFLIGNEYFHFEILNDGRIFKWNSRLNSVEDMKVFENHTISMLKKACKVWMKEQGIEFKDEVRKSKNKNLQLEIQEEIEADALSDTY